MTRCFASLAAAVLLTGAAWAEFSPNDRQRNAIENISQVVAGSRKCDDWKLNELLFAAVQRHLGFSINDAETFDYVDGRVMFHMKRIEPRTRADICEAMGRLFGPGGSAVDGLAMPAK